MAINVYLNFEGNSEEVIKTYARIFNIPEPQMMRFGDVPPAPDMPPTPPEVAEKIMHCQLDFADSCIMFSDTWPGMPLQKGNNVQLMLGLKNLEELTRIYNELAKEGQVTMPLQETFWTKAYGALIDKFGIHWQLNYEGEQL